MPFNPAWLLRNENEIGALIQFMLGSIFLVLSHNQTVVMLFIVCLGFR